MSRWSKPSEVTDLDMAFGGAAMNLMPPMSEIPEPFKAWGRGTNPWVGFQGEWFALGLAGAQFYPNEGIDAKKAVRHLRAIQGSFEPKHEHKMAGVAYLASLWFEAVVKGDKVFADDPDAVRAELAARAVTP